MLTLNRRIKPLTAVVEDRWIEPNACDYDPSSTRASILSEAMPSRQRWRSTRRSSTLRKVPSQGMRTSSLLVFRIKNFFVEQVDPNDQQKTGRAFDLIYNLGIAMQNEHFHDRMGDASGWRHAVLAGIVPRSLLHATSINGHLYGILLRMLQPFCSCRSWPNPIVMKALGHYFSS